MKAGTIVYYWKNGKFMKLLYLPLLVLAALCQDFADKSVGPVTVASKRALIIGNGTYQHQDRIPQALNDADDMKTTLTGLGFIVTVRKDLATLDDLNREVYSFINTLKKDDLALVYYSGHGGMVDGENYILPLNYARPALPRQVVQRAFRMSDLKKDLEESAARVRVLIFDACRNNSLVGEKSTGGGYVGMGGQAEGTIIAFASDEGKPALYDPSDRNSFYTKALRTNLAQRGVHLKEALERTQLKVFQDTRRTQRPYLNGFLTGPVFLTGDPVSTVTRTSNLCSDAWVMVKDGSDIGALRSFQQDFSECGPEVRLAKLRVTTLERRTEAPIPRQEPVARIDTNGPRTNSVDGLRYVWIPAGTFTMGCSPGDTECDKKGETPAKSVTLTRGFSLGESEVTQAAYQQVMGNNPSHFKGAERPVENVSWSEAREYCGKVGGRLPTEAEWERAARGGTTAARYGDIEDVGWYDKNSGNQTQPVKRKRPNAYGLYDMLGNVYEWTADWYTEQLPGGQDPVGPSTGTHRVLRGGSWNHFTRDLRVSSRSRDEPSLRLSLVGFRCAWD